jgi:hypothetical protein
MGSEDFTMISGIDDMNGLPAWICDAAAMQRTR